MQVMKHSWPKTLWYYQLFCDLVSNFIFHKMLEHTIVQLQTVPLCPVCFISLALWGHILGLVLLFSSHSITRWMPLSSFYACHSSVKVQKLLSCWFSTVTAWHDASIASIPCCFSCRWSLDSGLSQCLHGWYIQAWPPWEGISIAVTSSRTVLNFLL